MEEVWKDIPNYENYYQVSNFGNVRSVDRIVTSITGVTRKLFGKPMKIIKTNHFSCGSVDLRKLGTSKIYPVDKLVLMTFDNNFDYSDTVYHLDGNMHNNRLDNLSTTIDTLIIDEDINNPYWRSVPSMIPECYQVSRHGEVRSLRRYVTSKNNSVKIVERQILEPIDYFGYLKIAIDVNNSGTTVFIHRLVAEAFIPNPENKPTVNHIDGNKHNNDVTNLEWATWSEQQIHAFNLGLNRPNLDNLRYQNSLRMKSVVNIIDGKTFGSISDAAKYYDVNRCTLGNWLRHPNTVYRDKYQFKFI